MKAGLLARHHDNKLVSSELLAHREILGGATQGWAKYGLQTGCCPPRDFVRLLAGSLVTPSPGRGSSLGSGACGWSHCLQMCSRVGAMQQPDLLPSSPSGGSFFQLLLLPDLAPLPGSCCPSTLHSEMGWGPLDRAHGWDGATGGWGAGGVGEGGIARR